MNFSFPAILIGMVLLLLQVVVAVPWVFVTFAKREVIVRGFWTVFMEMFSGRYGIRLLLFANAGFFVVALLLPTIFFALTRDPDAIENWGRLYGVVLQTQLMIDFFVLLFPLLLLVWPKGGAIAQAAFREGVRQPMFWLLLGLAMLALGAWPFIPYFTFGEDYAMVKELGPDTIMFFALIFGVLAASLFVSEEIEGRTAVTLMSKPVSRRQFLLGKFVGILLVALVMFAILGTYYEGTLLLKRYLDKMDPLTSPTWVSNTLAHDGLPDIANDFLKGIGIWTGHSLDTLPGLLLSFCQVMVLVSIAVALATRLPMVVNLTIVLVVYLTGNVTPVLVEIGRRAQQASPGSVVAQMLSFVAQVFETILPGLDFFHIGATGGSDTPLPAGPFALYILSVTFYALLYTLIVILFGLVLFEDRDVA
jgi:hypothetical protein